MDFVTVFNAIEAAWWTGLGVLCWRKGRGAWTSVSRTAAIFFLFFAVSDVIEIQTGAWWQPWWLASAKGACLVGLTACGAWAWRIRRKSMLPPSASSPVP